MDPYIIEQVRIDDVGGGHHFSYRILGPRSSIEHYGRSDNNREGPELCGLLNEAHAIGRRLGEQDALLRVERRRALI